MACVVLSVRDFSLFVLLWICSASYVMNSPTRRTPKSNITDHIAITFSHFHTEFVPKTSEKLQHESSQKVSQKLELYVQCGREVRCNIWSSYCDRVIPVCHSCADLCQTGRTSNALVREACLDKCAVYLYHQKLRNRSYTKAAEYKNDDVMKNAPNMEVYFIVIISNVLILIIITFVTFGLYGKLLRQMKSQFQSISVNMRDVCTSVASTSALNSKDHCYIDGVKNCKSDKSSGNIKRHHKNTMFCTGTGTLKRRKSVHQYTDSQHQKENEQTFQKNPERVVSISRANSIGTQASNIVHVKPQKQTTSLEEETLLQSISLWRDDALVPYVPRSLPVSCEEGTTMENPGAKKMLRFTDEDQVREAIMVKDTATPSPIIYNDVLQRLPSKGCVPEQSKTVLKEGQPSEDSGCRTGDSLVNTEADNDICIVEIPINIPSLESTTMVNPEAKKMLKFADGDQVREAIMVQGQPSEDSGYRADDSLVHTEADNELCIVEIPININSLATEKEHFPTEQPVNIKAEYKMFKKEINRIRAPEYVQGSSCDEVSKKIYVDIDLGTYEKALGFFEAHFRIQMAQGIISLTEQEPMEYAANGAGDDEDQTREESSQYLVDKEVAPIYMPKREIAEGSRLIPVHAEPENQSPALRELCCTLPSFQQAIGNLCNHHTSIHDACISVIDGNSGNGTLGGFVVDDNGIVYGITAFHVLCAKIDKQIKAGEMSSCTKAVLTEIRRNSQDRIIPISFKVWGFLGGFIDTNVKEEDEKAIDFAIFEIPSLYTQDRGLFQFGFKDTSGKDVILEEFRGTDEVMLGVEVIKKGMVTDNLYGKIVLVNRDITIDKTLCGGVFAVEGLGKVSNFASRGDSGALVREQDGNRAFGIVVKIESKYTDKITGKDYFDLIWCVRLDRCFAYAKQRLGLSLSLYQPLPLSNASSPSAGRKAESGRQHEPAFVSGACAVVPSLSNVSLKSRNTTVYRGIPSTKQEKHIRSKINWENKGACGSTSVTIPHLQMSSAHSEKPVKDNITLRMNPESMKLHSPIAMQHNATGDFRKFQSDPSMISQWQRTEDYDRITGSSGAMSDPVKTFNTRSLKIDQKKDHMENSPLAFSDISVSTAVKLEHADTTQSSLFQLNMASTLNTNTNSSLFDTVVSNTSLPSPIPASDKEFEYPAAETEPLIEKNAASADAYHKRKQGKPKTPDTEKFPCDSGVGFSTS